MSDIKYSPRAPSSITRTGAFEPFELQAARGQISYHSVVSIFGYQPAVGTSFIPVWENATTYTPPGSAVVMTLASSNSGDTAVTVRINGLDANYSSITEVVALNGTTGVSSVNSYLRINGMTVVTGNPVGNITAKNGGTTYSQINIGVGRSQTSIYTVPAGYTFYLQRTQGFTNTVYTTGTYSTYRTAVTNSAGQTGLITVRPFVSNFIVDRYYPNSYSEKTDIQWQFSSSTGTLAVSFAAEGLLIKNDAGVA